jgi:hypothetical protein
MNPTPHYNQLSKASLIAIIKERDELLKNMSYLLKKVFTNSPDIEVDYDSIEANEAVDLINQCKN